MKAISDEKWERAVTKKKKQQKNNCYLPLYTLYILRTMDENRKLRKTQEKLVNISKHEQVKNCTSNENFCLLLA